MTGSTAVSQCAIDRPGDSTSGVSRTTGSVAISCNDVAKL